MQSRRRSVALVAACVVFALAGAVLSSIVGLPTVGRWVGMALYLSGVGVMAVAVTLPVLGEAR